jgi:hypothetical protein
LQERTVYVPVSGPGAGEKWPSKILRTSDYAKRVRDALGLGPVPPSRNLLTGFVLYRFVEAAVVQWRQLVDEDAWHLPNTEGHVWQAYVNSSAWTPYRGFDLVPPNSPLYRYLDSGGRGQHDTVAIFGKHKGTYSMEWLKTALELLGMDTEPQRGRPPTAHTAREGDDEQDEGEDEERSRSRSRSPTPVPRTQPRYCEKSSRSGSTSCLDRRRRSYTLRSPSHHHESARRSRSRSPRRSGSAATSRSHTPQSRVSSPAPSHKAHRRKGSSGRNW